MRLYIVLCAAAIAVIAVGVWAAFNVGSDDSGPVVVPVVPVIVHPYVPIEEEPVEHPVIVPRAVVPRVVVPRVVVVGR